MGKHLSKIVPSKLYLHKTMVTKHELDSLVMCIKYLKENHRFPGLFLNYGSQRPINSILAKISKGDPLLLIYLQQNCTPRQCASAVMAFLRSRHRPLLPNRVQELLIAQNAHISPGTVASDALGILQQDTKRHHLHLLYAVFDLLRTLSTVGSLRPTETQVSFAPHLIMPVLFKPSYVAAIQQNWQNITNILYEMIMHVHLIKSRPDMDTG